ncbi:response regulator [Lederbergia citri]|uniref:Response regulator n=1 Tax=Lederbergia citri TaxID=2833580 RepID=A0A942YH21_9BACI|nr:response regulator [Lederbergia citri]MBS4196112.1 response regulator [Lederbergia citri]
MKVLIIDDEVIIREGMSSVIDWAGNGFQLLEPAASAEEGLEIIRKDLPDIIFTDIKMNGMSGLDMASQVKREYPEIEIIILSGYDEFTYAQKAIREGVNEYLLKTSGPEEIIQSALKAKERIFKKREENDQNLKGKIVIKRNLLEGLVLNHADPQICTAFPNLKLENSDERLQILLIFLHEQNISEPDYILLYDLLKKELGGTSEFEVLLWKDCVLLIRKNKQLQSEIEWMKNKIKLIEHELNCNLFIAVGSNVKKMEDIHQSYTNAKQVVNYRWIMDFKGYVFYEQIRERKGMRRVCTVDEEAEFITILKSGSKEKAKKWINQLLTQLKQDKEITPESFELYIKSLIIAGYRWLSRVASSLGKFPPNQEWKLIDNSAWLINPEKVMRIYIAKIIDKFLQLSQENKHYTQKAIIYIQDHLDRNITLQEVADYVHINPNYFSEVFKREVGKSYIEFVKNARMEKAISILIETPAKISDVARQVGYEDIKYFSQQFRKYTGYTPSDYRKRMDNIG